MKIAFLTKNIKICKVLFQHRVMKDLGLLKFGVYRKLRLRGCIIRGFGNDIFLFFIWDKNYAANRAIFVEIVVIALVLLVFMAVRYALSSKFLAFFALPTLAIISAAEM